MISLSGQRASTIFKAARAAQVLIAGDVMLDEFVWGRVSRISPEAPVPVVDVVRRSFHLGGAANVAHNLYTLGGSPLLVGVLGEDEAARRFREVLEAVGISGSGLIGDPSRPTTLKTRIVAHSQQVVRADRESREDLPTRVEDEVLRRLSAVAGRARVLVLSDYSKGVLTPRVLTRSIAIARRRKIPVLVDPKLKRFSKYRGASLVTPNLQEAERASGISIDRLPGLSRAAGQILTSLRCRAVLITRGDQGMSLFEVRKQPLHIRAAGREVFDVTGAGDTVIATLALALAGGASLPEAAMLANQAAGIVVGKLGTATVGPEELVESLSQGPTSSSSASGPHPRR